MEFHTFHNTYEVLYCEKERRGIPVYLCRKISDGQLYELFSLDKRFVNTGVISYLNQVLQNEQFQDFHDLFVQNEQLLAVMCYHEAPTLETRLSEALGYEERLMIIKNLLERLLITKMPQYFCYQCMNSNQILINSALEVEFSYELKDVEAAPGITQEHVWNAFASLLKEVWEEELFRQNAKSMEAFLQYLTGSEEKTMEAVYRAYLELMSEMSSIEEGERNQSRRLPFRVWDRIKKGIPVLKKILAILMLLALAGYAGYCIWEAAVPHEKNQEVIRYIGTRNIR